MLLQREETEGLLKCCRGKADQYAKTLSLLATILCHPDDTKTVEWVRKELHLPAPVSGENASWNAWLPDLPTRKDILSVLDEIEAYRQELTRLNDRLS